MINTHIKKQLIEKILSIEDQNLLEEINRILKISVNEDHEITLSDRQKSDILKGITDIEEGRYRSNEETNKDIDQWLRK